MGIGVNVAFLLTQPSFVADYGREAWLPFYRTLTESVIAPQPRVFGILLILFEVVMGLFLLSSGVGVKLGLIGSMIFVLALIPLYVSQIAGSRCPLITTADSHVLPIYRNWIIMAGWQKPKQKAADPPAAPVEKSRKKRRGVPSREKRRTAENSASAITGTPSPSLPCLRIIP
jgi:hypothetical protein